MIKTIKSKKVVEQKKTHIFFAVGVAIIFIGFGTLIYRGLYQKPADCIAIAKQADNYFKAKQYVKSYDLLKAHETACLESKKQNSSHKQVLHPILDNAQRAHIYGTMAVSSFVLRNHLATTYAAKVIKINNNMTPLQRSKIANQNVLLINMFDIQSGIYNPNETRIL